MAWPLRRAKLEALRAKIRQLRLIDTDCDWSLRWPFRSLVRLVRRAAVERDLAGMPGEERRAMLRALGRSHSPGVKRIVESLEADFSAVDDPHDPLPPEPPSEVSPARAPGGGGDEVAAANSPGGRGDEVAPVVGGRPRRRRR